MPLKSLDSLVRIGTLKAESVDAAEYAGLRRSGEIRLKDADNPTLSLESRFDLAYNAAHALALAALRRQGYRSNKRYLVFQTLEHSLAMPPEKWRVLEKAHRLRNLAEYEGDLNIDGEIVAAVIRIARVICTALAALPPLGA